MKAHWRLGRVVGLAALAAGVTLTWFSAVRPDSLARAAAPTNSATVPTTAPSADGGKTTVIKRGDLSLSFDFDGTFAPVNPTLVKIEVRRYDGDFVVAKAATANSRVVKGDALLQLETDKIDLQIGAAENDLQIAQANLAKAQSDVDLGAQADTAALASARDMLSTVRTALKRWDDKDGANTVLASSTNAKISDFEVESASDELDELRKMYKSEDLTNETADIVMKRAIRTLDLQKLISLLTHATADRMADFEAGVQRLQFVDTVLTQESALAQLQAAQKQGAVLRQTSLVSVRDSIEVAQKKLAELKSDRDAFSVTAPADGVVVYGAFDHGTWNEVEPERLAVGKKVSAGQVLMTMFSPTHLRFNAQCPEAQSAVLVAGSKVTVFPVALPGVSYDGVCNALSLMGKSNGAQQIFDFTIELPAVDERLAPGYKASVNFDAGTLHNVLLVPASAVWHGKVWVIKPGQSEGVATNVVIGATNGEQTEIKSGLNEGDVVLTQAHHPGTASN